MVGASTCHWTLTSIWALPSIASRGPELSPDVRCCCARRLLSRSHEARRSVSKENSSLPAIISSSCRPSAYLVCQSQTPSASIFSPSSAIRLSCPSRLATSALSAVSYLLVRHEHGCKQRCRVTSSNTVNLRARFSSDTGHLDQLSHRLHCSSVDRLQNSATFEKPELVRSCRHGLDRMTPRSQASCDQARRPSSDNIPCFASSTSRQWALQTG